MNAVSQCRQVRRKCFMIPASGHQIESLSCNAIFNANCHPRTAQDKNTVTFMTVEVNKTRVSIYRVRRDIFVAHEEAFGKHSNPVCSSTFLLTFTCCKFVDGLNG